jgi:hypothetical protein
MMKRTATLPGCAGQLAWNWISTPLRGTGPPSSLLYSTENDGNGVGSSVISSEIQPSRPLSM